MMTLPQFELHRPQTVEEALEIAHALNRRQKAFDWISGGTDLLMNYKNRLNTKPHLISLQNIEALQSLKKDEIGAGVALRRLETWDDCPPVMQDGLKNLASPLIRETATIGGNLMVDTRCFFFNQSAFWRKSLGYCLKAEGDRCHVVPQKETCYATYSSDLGPGLMVLDASIVLHGPDGERTVNLRDFYSNEGIDRHTKAPDELLTKVVLPAGSRELKAGYSKLRLRDTMDFPAMGIAIGVRQGLDESIKDLRIAVGGVEMAPLFLADVAQKYIGEQPTADTLDALAADTMNATRPVKNLVVPTRYRKKMVRVYARRLLGELLGEERITAIRA